MTHNEDTYMAPSETIYMPYDVLEIKYHEHFNNQTKYLVTQWSPEILSQEQIDACINEEFLTKAIHLITHQTGQPTYEVY
jgi:hypothetical protein